MERSKVIIMGAGGRDFHNFNLYYRDNERYEVVAFTATQIPGIENRVYPAELAGSLYPRGIPICSENELESLIREHKIDEVVFAYSDVSHEYVMHKASQVLALGADFKLLGPAHTQLKSRRPVISVCASRTGSGKSQTSRAVVQALKAMGQRVVVIRHPMPYGNLYRQQIQRFADFDDLDEHETTIEEREEYEPHLEQGAIVYAGVDYAAILAQAEEEADILIWDGGNNDLPFYVPDLHIVVVDPHRPGHELRYYPGEANVRMANIVIINKVDTADYEAIRQVRENVESINPSAIILEAASPLQVDNPDEIRGKRVLVVEDGPTLTHGEMSFGAGIVAARRYRAAEIIDPRPFAVGSIAQTFAHYPQIEQVLPAMGYGKAQIDELATTINRSRPDVVIAATPIDLTRLISVEPPIVRVRYALQVIGKPTLEDVLRAELQRLNLTV
ncbi:MAG: cyclic 2,3-diphosphoglycerate synthase [Chloroflexota bacterium]|nr:MAG: GTPase [Chloroflexota bacterium]